jgi:hypothetical protein
MPAARPFWPPWRPVLLAALLATALALALVASSAARRADRGHVGAPPGAGAAARACVTPRGVCPIAAGARAGDPCGCPHPLRGSVPGHVERVGGAGAPALAGGRDWPGEGQGPADPLAPLGPLRGP